MLHILIYTFYSERAAYLHRYEPFFYCNLRVYLVIYIFLVGVDVSRMAWGLIGEDASFSGALYVLTHPVSL